ncbi:hypothetical protein FK268_12770 [Tsukamurella sputi]|uniref:Phage FDXHR zinc binding domain-containing protein n=1 Tax=Tsukamurella sputi TaxID=2591848 RepID=A0A5C5RJK4_9ACTN|nr:hypothetical protein [Tsukamurella sputi]TWS23186.1 hypothetical protein FK268_12770 [Tsukamurella sputi]
MPTPFGPTSRSWITCDCGAQWTGLVTCHCPTCHCTFSGITAFDRHRVDEQCVTPGLRGLIPRWKRPGFVAWSFPGSRDRKQ